MNENDGLGDIFGDESGETSAEEVLSDDATTEKSVSPPGDDHDEHTEKKARRSTPGGRVSKESIKEALNPERAEAAAEEYTRPARNILSAKGYSQPDIPKGTEGIIYAVDNDGVIELDSEGNDIILYVPPKVLSTWRCEYYLQPWRKARLARHMVIAVLLFLLTLSSAVTSTVVPYTTILATIACLLLILNLAFRYGGIALYKRPMPPIPFLSNLRFPTKQFVKSYEEALAEAEAEGTTYVKSVERYSGDTPSPATILTRWMNGVAKWSSSDLSENSGGLLDSFKVKLLLNDDEAAWTDAETLKSLAKVTGSSEKQWSDAWSAYDEALNEERDNA